MRRLIKSLGEHNDQADHPYENHGRQQHNRQPGKGSGPNGTYLSPKEAFSGSSTGKKESETPALLLGIALFRSALVGSKLAFSLE
jgi:hypothetical protein